MAEPVAERPGAAHLPGKPASSSPKLKVKPSDPRAKPRRQLLPYPPCPGRPTIRVLLIGEHTSFRQALAFVLQGEPDICVVAQAGSLAEASGALQNVDAAVGDLGLPDAEGVDLVRKLRASNPNGAMLILTASADRRQHARAVQAGAAGVLHKSVGIVEIITAEQGFRESCGRLGRGNRLRYFLYRSHPGESIRRGVYQVVIGSPQFTPA
jgi:CheY-like chemotaxis protein